MNVMGLAGMETLKEVLLQELAAQLNALELKIMLDGERTTISM